MCVVLFYYLNKVGKSFIKSQKRSKIFIKVLDNMVKKDYNIKKSKIVKLWRDYAKD